MLLGIGLIGAEIYLISPSVRTVVVDGAEWVGADEYLVSQLADTDFKVREHARDALLRRGAKAVPALVAALNDSSPGNRGKAAATLARMGGQAKDAIPALRQRAVMDEDESVLESAGEALGKVGRESSETVADMLRELDSPEDAQRLAAIRAVAWFDDRRAVAPLPGLLKHPNPKIRAEAAESLGEIGEEAAEALPALMELLADSNMKARGEARGAIIKITKSKSSKIDREMITRAEQALEKAGYGRLNLVQSRGADPD